MKKLVMMMVALGMTVAALAAQCTATTLKGTRCKRATQDGSALCWQHTKMKTGASGVKPLETCQAKTAEGKRCSHKVESGVRFCWQHAKKGAKATPASATDKKETAKSEAGTAKAKAKAKAKPVKAETSVKTKDAVSGQCQAKTAAGTPCKRKAQPGKKFCAQHAK